MGWTDAATLGARMAPQSAERRLWLAGCAALVLLPNGDLLNYLARGTPLVIWKQLLAVLLTALAIPVWQRARRDTREAQHLAGALLFALAFLSAASLIQGVSLYRLSYALLLYAGFLATLAFVEATLALGRVRALFLLFSVLGAMCGAGLVYDYFVPTFDFLPRAADADMEASLEWGALRRASFFFGASTTLFPFLGLTLVAAFMLFIYERRRWPRWVALATILCVPAGLLVTGSRAQVTLGALLLGGGLLTTLWRRPRATMLLLVLIIAAAAGGPAFMRLAVTGQEQQLTERYLNPFATQAAGNDVRYQEWARGGALMTTVPGLDGLFGSGLGRSYADIDDGLEPIPHYESTLFQAYAEGGWLAVAVRYLPALMALPILMSAAARGSPLGLMLLGWLVLYLGSVTTSPTAGAYHTQMAYFSVVMLAFRLRAAEAQCAGAGGPTCG